MTTQNGEAAAATRVVFIDSTVPDLQDLLSGLAPGETAYVLDPGSDGLEQIAAILAANNLFGLASISIVGHGAAGELRLGSSLITDAGLAADAGALARIGAALAPGGDLQLFGCDVASGAAGQRFIADLSRFAGGATVEAATHLVGSAQFGGSWTLDASTGPSPAVASVPFTDAAQANFQGSLVALPTGQLFFAINNGNDIQIGRINSDGSSRNTVFTDTADDKYSVAVDTAAGLIFLPGRSTPGSGDYDTVVVRSLATGAVITTVSFGAHSGDINLDDVVEAVAIDPVTHTLLVSDWGTTTDNTGVREFSYDPDPASGTHGQLTAVASNGGFLFTATQTESTAGNTATTRYINGENFFFDRVNHLLYYVDQDSGYDFAPFHATNAVFVVSTLGPTFAPTQLTSNGAGTGQFPNADQAVAGTLIGAHGDIIGIAVDVAHGIVYFETTDTHGSANIGLWAVNTIGANQTATEITLPANAQLTFAGQTNADGVGPGLSFDSQNRQLYLSNTDNFSQNAGAIFVLQLDSTGHNVTLVRSFDTATLVGTTPGAVDSNDAPSATAFDILPVLTVSDPITHAGEQGASIVPEASVTSSDADGGFYSSATVQITGGTFVANETSANDDHLTVLDGVTSKTSGTFSGTNIAISYTLATETLTLSGYDTIAHYNTVLSAVHYNTTGDNPTDFGNDPTRTLTWTVSDGALNIPAGSQNSGTTTLTIDAVDDPPVNGVPGLNASGNEDTLFTLTGLSVSDVDADPANQNIQVTWSVSHGTLTLNTGVGGGITGGEITAGASGTGTITVQATQNQINATLANATGLRYQGNLNFNTTTGGAESLQIVTDDLGHTGSGILNTDTDNLGITVAPVNDSPILSNVGPGPSTLEQTAVVLDTDAAVSDVDLDPLNSGAGSYTGASLTIARNGGANAQDTYGFNQVGFTVSGGNLQSGGLTFATFTSTGGTLTVNFTGSSTPATTALVNAVLDHITYTNTGDDPPASVTLNYTFNDGSPGNSQGSGATATATGSTTVTITPVNDPPTLSATAANPTYTEDAAGVAPFSAASASTIEAGQTITQLVLTVSNLSDGASEILTIGGTDVTLVNGTSVTTAVGGVGASVSVTGSTATVTLSKNPGIPSATVGALGAAMTYRNTNESPTPGGRVVTLTSITDDGGTANGGSDTTSGLSLASTVTVVSVNDPPAGTNNSKTINEDTSYIFSSADFGFSDPVDATGTGGANNFANVIVTTLPAAGAGTLTLNGNPVSAGQAVAVAAIPTLLFTPQANVNGAAAFTFQVQDDGGTANGGVDTDQSPNTFSFTITPVNDSPVLANVGPSVAAVEQTAVVLDSNATVSDVDLDAFNNGNGDYAGATLTIARNGGANAEDTYGFNPVGFTVNGGNLQSGGLTFATFTSAGGTLTITFTSSGTRATTVLANAVLDHITYTNTSNAPPASVVLDYTFNDGSPGPAGLQGSGATGTATGSTTVNITPVNDPPTPANDTVLTNAASGATISLPTSALLANDSDPDGDPLSVVSVSGAGASLVGQTANFVLPGSFPGTAASFTYTVADPSNAQASATVTVNGVAGATVTGTAGDDIIVLAGTGAVGKGGAGQDIIVGSANDDVLAGGPGIDTLIGGPGDDTYYVDSVGDTVTELPGGGTDAVVTTSSLTIPANVEALWMNGSGLTGTGSAGNDVLVSFGGPNTLVGGAGDDLYYVGNTGDTVTEAGGGGNDTVVASVNFTIPANVEALWMSGSGLTGTGSAGNDLLVSFGGPNILIGGGGDDTYVVGNTGDTVTEAGGGGFDEVISSVSFTIPANVEALLINGNGLTGTGSAGNDILVSFGGPNTLIGGLGDDTYFVGNPGDTVTELPAGGNDAVVASVNFIIPANVEALWMNGSGLTGTGSAGNDVLVSLGGPNTLVGGAGDDVYYVGNPGDTVSEGANGGNDAVVASVSLIIPANVEALWMNGSGLTGTGSAGGDLLISIGANTLIGNGGSDAFLFFAGQAGGSTITDFSASDALDFVGYGAGASFSQTDATHGQVDFNGGASHDFFTFANAPTINPAQVFFS